MAVHVFSTTLHNKNDINEFYLAIKDGVSERWLGPGNRPPDLDLLVQQQVTIVERMRVRPTIKFTNSPGEKKTKFWTLYFQTEAIFADTFPNLKTFLIYIQIVCK